MRDRTDIARFAVLLLDLNDTFMFGGDRFGPAYDYAVTYASLGGRLPASVVRQIIQDSFDYLLARYPDPAYHDAFPTVRDALRHCWHEADAHPQEVALLEKTFALHEVGHVPAPYAQAVQDLAETHRLGLVADIWSTKEPWLEALDRAGVLDAFEILVFSSDHGSVKPSPRPFQIAMERMTAKPEECVVVGDSARRNVGGAKTAGIAAVWIGTGTCPPGAAWVVSDLLDLVGKQ